VKNGSRVKVIYVVGYGRSGSTILDTVLGSFDDVEGVGELNKLVKGAVIHREYCACGQFVGECDFWNQVRYRWLGNSCVDNEKIYYKLQQQFERVRSLVFQPFTRSYQQKNHSLYRDLSTSLYQSISEISRRSAIVDSSKNLPRAYYLLGNSNIELYIIHLVRDGRGVAHSLNQAHSKNLAAGIQQDLEAKSVVRTTILWVVVNLIAEWVISRHARDKVLRVRYEDFARDPTGTVQRIGEMTGIESLRQANIVSDTCFHSGHTVAGNRMRMSGNVAIRLNESWREKMGIREKTMFETIAGWLLTRYGYTKN
jgi:hypothetical protein